MVFLILSFICSAILILLFKVFERSGVPIFQAIVFNYCTAAMCGFIFLPEHRTVTSGQFLTQPWFPLSVLLGAMFIAVFNLTSLTTVNFGVSTASVASKLGLVFPVLFAFCLYGESFNAVKLAGILLAFVAVILSSVKEKPAGHSVANTTLKFLPYAVFFSNGACDSVTQYANKHYLMHDGIAEFAMFIFVAAATVGLVLMIYMLITRKSKLNRKSIIGGIALGVPNYLSFLFLLKALATLNWGSSVIFPISNLGTVAVATVVSFIVFKEKISKVNLTGLAFAAAAIILIVLSS